jgi:hypothetical protein
MRVGCSHTLPHLPSATQTGRERPVVALEAGSDVQGGLGARVSRGKCAGTTWEDLRVDRVAASVSFLTVLRLSRSQFFSLILIHGALQLSSRPSVYKSFLSSPLLRRPPLLPPLFTLRPRLPFPPFRLLRSTTHVPFPPRISARRSETPSLRTGFRLRRRVRRIGEVHWQRSRSRRR